MTGPVLHQGPAEVAIGEPPRSRQVLDTIADIHLGLCEFGWATFETQHGRRRWPDLHQADLSDPSDDKRVIAAFNLGNGVRDLNGQTC
jgi:predicted secreted protein